MMFGFRDEFTYFECSKCGCIQIIEIPRNMGKYYTPNYYSFKKLDKPNNFIKRLWKKDVDPYLREATKEVDVEIYNKSIYGSPNNQKYDLIIYNHSFEHIINQLEFLLKVRKILSREGTCFIVVPIKTDYIWNCCNANGMQINVLVIFMQSYGLGLIKKI